MKYGLVFGGSSFEHEVSIVSAIALKNVLKEEAVFIFCDKDRDFYLISPKLLKSKLFSSGEYKKSPKLTLKKGGFYQKSLLKENRAEFEILINLIHGRDGEDGKIAALLDFFEIKYIGPRIEASVISYNKLYTKWYAKEIGIKTIDYELLQKGGYEIKTPLPVIVKPLRLGSSIGVSVVREKSELSYALDVAYEFDKSVIIEPFMEGVKEYNLAGCMGEDFIFSTIEEPQKEEFLDFEKKYLDFSRTKQVLEAKIEESLKRRLKESFKKIYKGMFEGALIRCDFFVIDDEIYLNEINPIPGSYANYLFDDFNKVLDALSQNLPKDKEIDINYAYIDSIQKAKGK